MSGNSSQQELSTLLQSGYRYALSLVRDKARAEDVLQEAWVATLRADGPRTKPYLFTAIRSRYINSSKRDSLLTLVSIDDAAELQSDDSSAAFANHNDEFDAVHIEEALAELRAVERETIYLMVVEGYTAQEVSEITKQPRNTVLSLSHRARKKMRHYLEVNYGDVMP
jgi:RNA polymerase sigma-70 factor (ECF subfamily)